VIDTAVFAYDPECALTALRFDGGELIVPNVEALAGERVCVRIRARDVSLAVAPPAGWSIAARITRRSRVDLGLAEPAGLNADQSGFVR
jgi:molybdate transport system ATP-binding protein